MSDWKAASNGEYDPDKFYTSSRDKNKNKGTIRITSMPENIMAEISAAIASKRYPDLRVQADFMRDAAFHRAHYMAHTFDDKKLQRAVEKDMAECELARQRESMDKEKKAIEDITQSLHDAAPVDIGEIVRAGRRYLDMMEWTKYKTELNAVLDRYKRAE